MPWSSGDNEVLIFKLKENHIAGCNTAGRYSIDSSNKKYKATLSAIIAAFHAQTNVTVTYLPTCDYWHNSADVNHICVGDINC